MHASHQIFCTLKYTMVFSPKNWEIDIFHRKNMGPLRVHGRTIKSKYKTTASISWVRYELIKCYL